MPLGLPRKKVLKKKFIDPDTPLTDRAVDLIALAKAREWEENNTFTATEEYENSASDESLFSYENINRICSGLPYPLTDEQYDVSKKLVHWIRNDCNKIITNPYQKAPFKRLAGFAGSGKTAIISWLITEGYSYFPQNVKNKAIAICSFTWKAALVLQGRGIKDACSIHSIFYEVEGVNDGKPYFTRRTKEEIQSAYSLIIVDEASMVGSSLRDDLEYYGVPVLYVGDAGQ